MSKTVVIECANISKEFGKKPHAVGVLKNLNFKVYSGEYVIVFGPSGCGKTTLLNIIAGLERPTTGKITIRGQDITKLTDDELAWYHRTKIGMVFQNFNLIRGFSVLENIALPQTAAGYRLQRRINRAEHLLELFHLQDTADQIPTELSGGQQQRISLARAMVNEPWILLVDEPTGNLDSKAAEEVMDIIYGLNRRSKRTVLLVTHNEGYIYFAHRVIYMKDGQFVKEVINKDIRGLAKEPGTVKEQVVIDYSKLASPGGPIHASG